MLWLPYQAYFDEKIIVRCERRALATSADGAAFEDVGAGDHAIVITPNYRVAEIVPLSN